MALPLTGFLLVAYNNLPAIPPTEPLGDLLNQLREWAVLAVSTVVAGTHAVSPGDLILANATAGIVTLNLPAASTTVSGTMLVVKKIDNAANKVSVVPNGTDTVEGVQTAFEWDTALSSYTFVSDGTSAWWVV
jgi:hypothetical protein